MGNTTDSRSKAKVLKHGLLGIPEVQTEETDSEEIDQAARHLSCRRQHHCQHPPELLK